MTTIGLLVMVILTSLLLACLDMLVYRESYLAALSRQSFDANKQSFLILASAFLLAIVQDVRMKRAANKNRQEPHPHG